MLPLFKQINLIYNTPRKNISDNVFISVKAYIYYTQNNIKYMLITLNRSQSINKVKRANGVLKYIIVREIQANRIINIFIAVRRAVKIIDRIPYCSGHFLYFLLFGTVLLKYNNIPADAPKLFY